MRLFERESQRAREIVAIAVGAGVTLAAGVLLWQWYRGRRGGGERQLESRLARLEEEVVRLLRGDERVSGQPVEVAALAEGIVELSGAVETQEDSERAVALAQRAEGVRTVLNRLDVLEELDRADQARRRPDGPGTPRSEARWMGIGVGTGRRRQSRETDPPRRDDRVEIIEESLGVDRAVEQTSEPLGKIPTASESGANASQSAPDDYGTIRDAAPGVAGTPQASLRDVDPSIHENLRRDPS